MGCNTVLVVEDDKDIRDSLKDFLEMENYDVVTASNGLEALNVLKNNEKKPCLMLLDLMMPVMGGRQLLDILMKDPVLALIPVFIVSAAVDVSNAHGATGFIRKPADINVVLEIVKSRCSSR